MRPLAKGQAATQCLAMAEQHLEPSRIARAARAARGSPARSLGRELQAAPPPRSLAASGRRVNRR